MRTPTQRRKQPTDSDVQAARGRLRGALNDSLQGQEVDDISEDYEEEEQPAPTPPPPPVVQRRPQRGRPRKTPAPPVQQRAYNTSPPLTPSKRRRLRDREMINDMSATGQGQKIQAESFVMKLFDRSLDLSKYTEQTALYPICRAWMANQPRNPSIRSYREARSPSPSERVDNGGDVLLQLRDGDIRDITSLPKPKKPDVCKIPPQREPQKYKASEELFDDNDAARDCDRKELISQYLTKWKGIKKDWQRHTKVYQKRNEVNFLILQELFKP